MKNYKHSNDLRKTIIINDELLYMSNRRESGYYSHQMTFKYAYQLKYTG